MSWARAFHRPTDGLAGAMAKKSKRKESCTSKRQVKISDEACREMLRDYLSGMPMRHAADKHGVREKYLYEIINGGNRQQLLTEVTREFQKK